jgi:glycosyltransferase involved in cell wall biosynthesis
MNVLLSAYACKPDSGSEPGFGWNWAMHLAERGINVTVLTNDDGRDRIEAYQREHPTANVEFTYVTVPTNLFKPHTGMHYALWQWFAVRVAKALHRQRRFDLVHHVTYGSIHVPTQLWRLGVPTVFGPVGGGQTAPPNMLSYFGSSRGSEVRRTVLTKALRYSPFHRRWLRKMSTIYAANSDTLALVKALGRSDVSLKFDVGVPKEFLASEPRDFASEVSSVRLLWVATIVPRKGLPLALDALAKVRHPWTLTVVGNGLAEDQVRCMIAERGLNDRVHWSGRRLTLDEVRMAYLEHDALLFTSVRETCGVQLLEAMALGLPVITLDLHGARDMVPANAGIKVPVSTPNEVVCNLAAAVDRLASMSVEQKNAMSRAGWEFARANTWTCRAAKAEALYTKLVGRETDDPLTASTARHNPCRSAGTQAISSPGSSESYSKPQEVDS